MNGEQQTHGCLIVSEQLQIQIQLQHKLCHSLVSTLTISASQIFYSFLLSSTHFHFLRTPNWPTTIGQPPTFWLFSRNRTNALRSATTQLIQCAVRANATIAQLASPSGNATLKTPPLSFIAGPPLANNLQSRKSTYSLASLSVLFFPSARLFAYSPVRLPPFIISNALAGYSQALELRIVHPLQWPVTLSSIPSPNPNQSPIQRAPHSRNVQNQACCCCPQPAV